MIWCDISTPLLGSCELASCKPQSTPNHLGRVTATVAQTAHGQRHTIRCPAGRRGRLPSRLPVRPPPSYGRPAHRGMVAGRERPLQGRSPDVVWRLETARRTRADPPHRTSPSEAALPLPRRLAGAGAAGAVQGRHLTRQVAWAELPDRDREHPHELFEARRRVVLGPEVARALRRVDALNAQLSATYTILNPKVSRLDMLHPSASRADDTATCCRRVAEDKELHLHAELR